MTKWFDNTFLPSLFNRYGANNHSWLTAKQTAICTDNMELHTAAVNDGYTVTRHKYFTYLWEGRTVTLQYSSKNGCGTICFSSNEAEAMIHATEAKQTQDRIKIERLDRIKNNPARLSKRIHELKNKIISLTDDLTYTDYSVEFINETKKLLSEAKLELQYLEHNN